MARPGGRVSVEPVCVCGESQGTLRVLRGQYEAVAEALRKKNGDHVPQAGNDVRAEINLWSERQAQLLTPGSVGANALHYGESLAREAKWAL